MNMRRRHCLDGTMQYIRESRSIVRSIEDTEARHAVAAAATAATAAGARHWIMSESSSKDEYSQSQDRTDERIRWIGIQMTWKTLGSFLVTLVLGCGDDQ